MKRRPNSITSPSEQKAWFMFAGLRIVFFVQSFLYLAKILNDCSAELKLNCRSGFAVKLFGTLLTPLIVRLCSFIVC